MILRAQALTDSPRRRLSPGVHLGQCTIFQRSYRRKGVATSMTRGVPQSQMGLSMLTGARDGSA